MAQPQQGPPPIAFFYSRLHKAIRQELTHITDDVLQLRPEIQTQSRIQSLQKKLQFLSQIYDYHSVAEDEIVYPALDSKVRNVTVPYRVEHAEESHLFVQLMQLLESMGGSASSKVIGAMRDLACKVEEISTTIRNHLAKEEEQLFPLLLEHFSYSEQASMIAQFLFCIPMMAVRGFMDWIEPVIGCDERRQLLGHMQDSVTDRLRLSILSAWILPSDSKNDGAAGGAETATGRRMDDHLPPLLQLSRFHRSIDGSLESFITEARGLVHSHNATEHLNSLLSKHRFLKEVYRFQVLFDEECLFPELLKQYPATETAPCAVFRADHVKQWVWFDDLGRLLTDVRSAARRGCKEETSLLNQVVECAEEIRDKIGKHQRREETEVFPLLQKRLGSGKQCLMLWQSLKMMPLRLLESVMPWISCRLSDGEYVGWIAALRIGGMEDSTTVELLSHWAHQGRQEVEAAVEMPQTPSETPLVKRLRTKPPMHPVDHIFQFHRALRRDIRLLESETSALIESVEMADAADWGTLVQKLKGQFTFIRGLYQAHSKTEDEVLFPVLESKEETQNISQPYTLDHRHEEALFDDIQQVLTELGEATSVDTYRDKALVLSRKCAAMRSDLETHIRAEEMELWPLFIEHFSTEEQHRIVGLVIGQTGAEVLQTMLPWVATCFTEEEKDVMMQSLHSATKKTRFDKWMQNWTGTGNAETRHKGGALSLNLTLDGMFRMNQSQLEAAVRQVSRDATLEPQRKSYLIQHILASEYITGQSALRSNTASDPFQSYHFKEDDILGCVHYRRRCALVTPCCEKVYVCRLCHDAEQDHTLDRANVTHVVCMLCQTRQLASKRCTHCSAPFARYFCNICHLYDDGPGKDIYHCPFCNICRRGKGLGVDFTHCMECNACWDVRVFSRHRCREKLIECDCPICRESIFDSHLPVQKLCCGHVLHVSCFEEYSRWNYRCPVCFKSVGDMSAYFRMLDALLASDPMPEPLREQKQRIACHDCGAQSTASFHYVYHSCQNCHSYNTRLL